MAEKRRWPEAIPLINYAINHAPSPLLGGKSPIEVAFGYTPKTPVELAMFRGVKYSGTMVAASQDVFGLQIYKKTSADNVDIETIPFADFLDGKLALLQDALAELHRVAFVRQSKRKMLQAARRKHYGMPQAEIGTFVLVGRRTPKRNKIQVNWQGPYVVTGVKSDYAYEVKLIGKPDMKPLVCHISRLRTFADKHLDVTEELKEMAMRDADTELEVEAITRWRYQGDELQLEVQWLGFDADDRSWEPIEWLHSQHPKLTATYIERVGDEDGRLLPALQRLQDAE